MDSRRNWILVDASSSRNSPPIRVAEPRYSQRRNRDEHRLETINRLNDRIHLKIKDHYRFPNTNEPGGTAREGARVIDESFRFIIEEEEGMGGRRRVEENEPTAGTSASDRLDSLISHRNAQGEVDAVYERRVPANWVDQKPNDIKPQQPMRQSRVPPVSSEFTEVFRRPPERTTYVSNDSDDAIYRVVPAPNERRQSRFATNEDSIFRFAPEPSSPRHQSSIDVYRRIPTSHSSDDYLRSPSLFTRRDVLERVPEEDEEVDRRRYRRADSLDSGSLRLHRQHLASLPRWQQHAVSSDELTEEYVRRPPYEYSGRPITLRRTPQYYDKCDLCAYKTFRPGEYCPACNRGAPTPVRYYGARALSRPTNNYIGPQILSARSLVPYQSRPPTRTAEHSTWDTNRMYATGYRPSPYSQRIRPPMKQPTKTPVYRYGASLPEALYDYEVWARRQDRRRLQKRAIALGLALLAFALVVSAGVILAAVHT